MKEIDKSKGKTIGEEGKDEHAEKEYIERTIETYAGPLPPPKLFEGYEQVLKGSADRILTMAEKEQSHRHSFEKDN